MELKKTTTGTVKYHLIFLSVLLVACQGLQRFAPEDRIALRPDGPHAGSWQSTDVLMKYQYIRQPGMIKLSIQAKAKRKYNQLTIWVSFLDTEGKVFESKTVYNSGYRQGFSRRYTGSVEKTLELPTETNYLAFRSMLQPYTGGPP